MVTCVAHAFRVVVFVDVWTCGNPLFGTPAANGSLGFTLPSLLGFRLHQLLQLLLTLGLGSSVILLIYFPLLALLILNICLVPKFII